MAFDFACPDWIEKLERGATPIADLPLDQRAADQAATVFEMLRVPDAPDQPQLSEAAPDWMRDIVRAIFGSMPKPGLKDGVRFVGEVFVLVPKKNGKTTWAAAVALTFMLLNQRRNADLLIIGPTQQISDTAYSQAKGMIEADPEGFLQRRFHVRDHLKMIVCRVTGARLMVKTFDTNVLTGCKPVFCLIDEVHVLGNKAHAADVIRQIRGGMLPFPESVLVMITTQSDGPPAGVFRSELSYARAVRDGRVRNARLLPVLYEFPEAMQRDDAEPWRDPATWHMVTPSLDRPITLARLEELMARAEEDGPADVIAWATQHLNVEVGMALHANRWIGADFWPSCAAELTLESLIERADVCVVGGDVGGADDLFGLAVLGRDRDTRQWLAWVRAWCTPVTLDRHEKVAARLRDFERAGDLRITDRARDHVVEAADVCERLQEAGLLPEREAIGLDPWGVAALVDELEARGFRAEQMMAVGQGYKLSGAIKGVERRLFDGTIAHGDQGLANWCVANARAEQKGNNIYITKETASGKIDPLVALFNAAQLMDRNPTVGSAPTPWDLDADFRMAM